MLDLQTQAFLKQVEEKGALDFSDLTPQDSRFFFSMLAKKSGLPLAPVEVDNFCIPGPGGPIPVRSYRPEGASGELPVVLFYHGGGFVIGCLDDYDGVCSTLAEQSDCLVLSVDYRLAPEHPYPAAVDDCYAALAWLAENAASLGADASNIALAGDSAGGNLAAVCALLARDRQGPSIRYQVLIYPATSSTLQSTESFQAFGEGHFLTAKTMAYFIGHYLGDSSDPADFRLAPLDADSLSALPPALVLVAGFDPLRDDGIAYASKMLAHGSQATLINYCGTIHGFVNLAGVLDVGRQAIHQIALNLRLVMHA